ncbi:MAG: hypothetical protein QM602_12425 [Microbacterium sp.]
MSATGLASRSSLRSVLVVWVAAFVVAVAIAVFVPVDWRMAWMTVGLGGCIVLAFVVQLWSGRSEGFIDRMALSVAGALLAMGLVSAAFGLAALLPGSVPS